MIPGLAFLLGIVALVAPVLILRSSAIKTASRGVAQAIAVGAVLFTMLVITMAAIMSPFAWMGIGLGILVIGLIGASMLSSAARGGVGDPLSQQEVERLLRVDFTPEEGPEPPAEQPTDVTFSPPTAFVVSPASPDRPAGLSADPPPLELPPAPDTASPDGDASPEPPPPPRLDA